MLSDNIILLCHIILLYGIALSPVINDCHYKNLILVFLLFILLQFTLKYGKCGLINIERFFLKEKFKQGFVFRLIKPLICYKRNPFYSQFYYLLLLYIFILFTQLYTNNCFNILFNDFKLVFSKLKQ